MTQKKIRSGERVFDSFNYLILIFIILIETYPIYFIIIASFSNPQLVNSGNVWLFPKGVSLEGYRRIFSDNMILIGYKNTIVYTVLGTAINVIVTVTAAYALSRKDFIGGNVLMFIFAFTMFFSGGMIPTYMIIRSLKMINTIWAMLIPSALSVYYLIICRTFFQTTIPSELLEAAVLDGCSNYKFYTKIVLPVSKALIAVMVLFYGVNHWNSFFDALLYLNDEKKYPLQYVLRNILIVNAFKRDMISDSSNASDRQLAVDMIKFGVIIVSSLPMLIVYPFLQKYFIQGIMIGSIKG